MDTTVIGQPLNRVEGRAKVTGRARYAADYPIADVASAYVVVSPIASGQLVALDCDAALKASGVLTVLHHGNVPKLHRCEEDMKKGVKMAETRTPFADNKIYYAGQFVALVVAETFAQARWAATLVKANYQSEVPTLTLDAGQSRHGAKPQEEEAYHRGDAAQAFHDAAVKFDGTYTTPVEVHHAMELHNTLAQWDGDHLTIHDTTQWVVGQRKTLARVLGVADHQVTVLAPFVGGGFGAKLFLWPHCVLAAVAAREVRRPVKLVLSRRDQFTSAGHRPFTRQRIRLGATREGQLVSVRHEILSHTSMVTDYVESCSETTRVLYSCPHLAVSQSIVPVNVGSPTAMRAPGSSPGMWALESAMDELAAGLAIDPVELRRRNLSSRDEENDVPWSSHHLGECIQVATDRFGWKRRDARPGSMKEGREIIGWGFAAASWPAMRKPATVRVELRADGSARVLCATQDIGTGTYTVFAQVVAEITRLPIDKIEVIIGSSALPPGPISGGSMATASVVPAIAEASRRALQNLYAAVTRPEAPLAGLDPKDLLLERGVIGSKKEGRHIPVAEAFSALGLAEVTGEAHTESGEETKKFGFRSFGAHCVEIRWDPGISRVRVGRVVSAFDVGRIINRKTATNQIHGAIVMGLGMAFLEHAIYDPRDGRVINDNLADYHLPVHADIPEMDVTFLDHPDPHIGEFGAKGLGEIGLTGIAPALANAVYHATGRRLRDLPLTIEKHLMH